MKGFEVISGGVFTLLQDLGRFDYTHLGVSVSGVMDEYAYNWANKLLNNHINANTLEISFAGLKLKSNIHTTIAITGADFNCKINGVSFSNP